MRCPTPQEYNEAIQNPAVCFSDSELKGGKVVTNAMGLPWSASGNFASVYRVTGAAGDFAVRCFLDFREEQTERYKIVSDYVRFDKLACTVDFHFIEEGIRVGGQWFPIIKMPWLEGDTLGVYVDKNARDPALMLELAKSFFQMVRELEDNDVAHGDLQHGNVIVTSDGLRLVDYDALFVPGLKGKYSLELGHPNYQHPDRNEWHFDATVDNFSTWVIYISLVCISLDPDIYKRFECGDDCLIFKKKDLVSPDTSAVFDELLAHDLEDIRALITLLSKLLWLTPQTVPPLDIPDKDLQLLPDDIKLIGGNEGPMPNDRSSEQALLRTAAPGFDSKTSVSLNKKFAMARAKFIKRTKARLSKSLDAALRGLAPKVWSLIRVMEGDRLFRAGKYEEAAEIFIDVQKAAKSESNLGFELLQKTATCYAHLGRDALCFFYVSLASHSMPAVQAEEGQVNYRREFMTRIASKNAETREVALQSLTSLLSEHWSTYTGQSATELSARSSELYSVMKFVTWAVDVLMNANFDDALWKQHIEQVVELEKFWSDAPQLKMYSSSDHEYTQRSALSKLYNYTDAIFRVHSRELETGLILGLKHSAFLSSGEISPLLLRVLVECDDETIKRVVATRPYKTVALRELLKTAKRIGCTADGIRIVKLLQRTAMTSLSFVGMEQWFTNYSSIDAKLIEYALDEDERDNIILLLSPLDVHELVKLWRILHSIGPPAALLAEDVMALVVNRNLEDVEIGDLVDFDEQILTARADRAANNQAQSGLVRAENIANAIAACAQFGREGDALAETLIDSLLENILTGKTKISELDINAIFQWLNNVEDRRVDESIEKQLVAVFKQCSAGVAAAGPAKVASILAICEKAHDEQLIEIVLNALLEEMLSRRDYYSAADFEQFRELASHYPVPLPRWQEFSDWYHLR